MKKKHTTTNNVLLMQNQQSNATTSGFLFIKQQVGKMKKGLLLVMLLIGSIGLLHAGIKTATTGNWDPTAGSNTSFASVTTTTSDSILVPNGVTVTVTGIVTCGALNIQTGGKVIYSSSSSRQITVVGGSGGNTGCVNIDGTLQTGNSNTQFISWNGSTFTFGSGATFTFSGTTSGGDGGFHYTGTTNTTFTANGKTIGPLQITAAGTVNISGNVNFQGQGTTGPCITLAATSNLVIPSGSAVTLSANNVTTSDFSIASGGKITLNGTAILDNKAGTNGTLAGAGTITLNGISKYIHDHIGATLQGSVANTITWNSGTTCEIKGLVAAATFAAGSQSFYNFYWNNAGATATCNLNGTLTSVAGTLDVQNTNNQAFQLTGATALTLNITGDLKVSGLNGISKLDICNGASSPNINVTGNVSIGGNSNSATLSATNASTIKVGLNWTKGANGYLLMLLLR